MWYINIDGILHIVQVIRRYSSITKTLKVLLEIEVSLLSMGKNTSQFLSMLYTVLIKLTYMTKVLNLSIVHRLQRMYRLFTETLRYSIQSR